jgi:surface carbohydrate biosynthesis protein
MAIDVIIPIEIAARELLSKVYLCHHLASRGLRCYLGSKHQISVLTEKLSNYIYLDKGYHKNISESIYAQIKKNNGLIVSLDEEGAVDYPDGSTLQSRYSKSLFENADLVFMWGSAQLDLIKNNAGANQKVKITGHPRFEMLKPEFNYLYQEDVHEIRNRFGDFILINTNMGFGNNIRGDAFVESNYGGRFRSIRDNIAFDKEKLRAYRQLITELSKNISKSIVIRPHPEEDRYYYNDVSKKYKNIHVVHEGPVIPWLLAAGTLIHPDCTTAIEALFLGKKPISYLPHDYPKNLVTHLPLQASSNFTSKAKLISFLKEREASQEQVYLKDYPFAEEYFSISNSSTEVIAEEIMKISKVLQNKKTSLLSFNELLQLKLISLKSRIPRWSKSFDLAKNKLGGVKEKIVYNIHEKINKNISGVKYQAITGQLFLFSKA